ncbi:MAG: hypothetical protein ACD_43C00132G0001, partial [uncultured bacterium]
MGDGERERFGGAIIEQQVLTPNEEGDVTEGTWQETEFHPSKYEQFIEGRGEKDNHVLLAKFDAPEGKNPRPALGVALRIDVWRATTNTSSPIVGMIVREVYTKRGIKTDMRPDDILLLDANDEIAPETRSGKAVPNIFRTAENNTKLSLLIADADSNIAGTEARRRA